MKKLNVLLFKLLVLTCLGCYAQESKSETKMNEKKIQNPLICDPQEGVCGIPGDESKTTTSLEYTEKDKIRVIYFTDPICSSCWGIEPQLRKLKLEYGQLIEFDHRMGGLLPDWSYNSGGINKPSDVAHHWDEVSLHYDMPIDGDIWLEDPLNSSYPPSIYFKAAQLQSNEKAIQFMRELRELLFLQKKNIENWEVVKIAAERAQLDIQQLQKDFDDKAPTLFKEDLELARKMGVRGFPSLFFIDANGTKEFVYGTRPYAFYEMAILKLNDKAVKKEYSKQWDDLFNKFSSLTAKEYAELSGMPRAESETLLRKLTETGKLVEIRSKNGSLWQLKK